MSPSGASVTGTRTIKQFYLIDGDNTSTEKVEDISMPLYLFFVSADVDKKGMPAKVLEHYKLRINWL